MTYVHTLVVTTDDPGYSAHIRVLLEALGQGLSKLDPSIHVGQSFNSVRPESLERPHVS